MRLRTGLDRRGVDGGLREQLRQLRAVGTFGAALLAQFGVGGVEDLVRLRALRRRGLGLIEHAIQQRAARHPHAEVGREAAGGRPGGEPDAAGQRHADGEHEGAHGTARRGVGR